MIVGFGLVVRGAFSGVRRHKPIESFEGCIYMTLTAGAFLRGRGPVYDKMFLVLMCPQCPYGTR